VFNGLNARGVLVLDANSAALDADYAGANALIAAIAAAPKAVIYLRPGVYNWSDASVLSSVTLVGGGSPTTNVGTTQVEIRNTAGNMRFASGTIVRNVLLTASGTVQLTGTTGGCLFENVHFKLTGNSLLVQNTQNVFRQCGTHISSSVATFLRDSGGFNSYDSLRVEQLEVLNIGKCTFTNLQVGSTVAPSAPASPLVNITAEDNVINQLSISHSGAALTSNALRIISFNNVFEKVRIRNVSTDVEVVLIGSGAANNTINNLVVLGCSGCGSQTSSGLVRLLCNDTVISNLRVGNATVAGTNNVAVLFSDGHNTINNFTAFSVSAASILRYIGVGNKVLGASISTGAAGAIVDFTTAARASAFRNARIGSFAADLDTAVFQVQGSHNIIEGVELPSITALAVPIIHFNGANGCKAMGLRVTGLAVTAGLGFNFVRFTSSANCTSGDIDVTTSPNLGTTSGLLLFQGSSGCVVDGLSLYNVATTTAINSPILRADTGTSRRCVVRNVTSSLTSYSAAGLVLFDIDAAYWDGLRLEHIQVSEGVALANHLKFRTTLSTPLRSTNLPIRVVDCTFANSSTTAGDVVLVDNNFGTRAILEGCTISGAGPVALRVQNSCGVEFVDCMISGAGPNTTTCHAVAAGARFTGCTIQGPGGGTGNGAQLFCGYGFAGSTRFPASPLVIEDCNMELGSRNVASTGVSRPQVFFGGTGNSSSGGHGATIVRGLTIAKGPSVTLQDMPAWHNHSTLAIDIINQALNLQSYFENITVDLGGTPFNGSATGATALTPINDGFYSGTGCVVEIKGPQSDSFTTSQSTVIKGLSLLRLPRQGFAAPPAVGTGERSALLASGVTLENLTVDALSGSSANNSVWGMSAVALSNCILNGADIYPSASLPLSSASKGGFGVVLLGTNTTHMRNVRMRNFYVSDSEQNFCVICADGSSLTQSYIEMREGSHVPTECAVIHADKSIVAENHVLVSHACGNYQNQRRFIMCGTECKVLNNRFENSKVPSGTDYPNRGGAAKVVLDGDNNLVRGNTLLYHFASDTDVCQAIQVSGGSRNKIVDNQLTNGADGTIRNGGTVAIVITSSDNPLYTYISGNHLVAMHSTGTAAQINTVNGSSSIIIGNFLDNQHGSLSGAITSKAGDKPVGTLGTSSPTTSTVVTHIKQFNFET
jgi:hypothetical protein